MSEAEMSDTGAALYDRDFFAWTQDQARRLRALRAARTNAALDLEHVAEEIEDMGKSDWRSAESLAERIVEHLLKLEFSPALEPRRGWLDSIDTHRASLHKLLRDSPSLHRRLIEQADTVFADGLKRARRGLERDGLRAAEIDRTPYDIDTELLVEDWYPANRHGLD